MQWQSWKRAGSPFPFPSHLQKENHASIRGFFVPIPRRFSRPLLRPWGRVFRFSAEIGIRDYIINIHVTPFVVEGARLPSSFSFPLLPLAWRRTQYTSAVLTCARYLPTQPCAPRCYSVHGHVYCIWPVPYLPSYRTSCLATFPLISSLFLSFSLPFVPSSCLRLLRRCSPVPWAERSGTHLLARIPTARGIKYNKDIQWELIGYLRIYRSLRAALLLRRGPRDGARAPPPPFSPSPRSFFSSLFLTPPSLPLLLRSLLFVFHLFAGRAAGSNGDIPRWNNIEPRF